MFTDDEFMSSYVTDRPAGESSVAEMEVDHEEEAPATTTTARNSTANSNSGLLKATQVSFMHSYLHVQNKLASSYLYLDPAKSLIIKIFLHNCTCRF